jgi:hypothetical protein
MDYKLHETQTMFSTVDGKVPDAEEARRSAALAFQRTLAEKDITSVLEKFDDGNGADFFNVTAEMIKLAADSVYINKELRLLADGPDSAHFSLYSHLIDDAELVPRLINEMAIRFSYMVPINYNMVDEKLVQYMQLSECVNYTTMKERLLKMIEDEFPTFVMRRLIKELTLHINDVLHVQMGIKLRMDNFLTDIDDLIAAIGKRYGDRIVEIFEATARDTAKKLFSYTKADGIFSDNSVTGAITDQTCIPAWNGMAVKLPIKASEFIANFHGYSAVVKQSKFPDMYEAISETLARAEENDRWVCFITNDGEYIRLWKSLVSDSLLISRLEPQ